MRYREPFTLIKRGKVWYYRLATDPKRVARSTGQAVKWQARLVAQEKARAGARPDSGTTLGEFVAPYFTWATCPHCRRLVAEGRQITRRHAENSRRLIDRFILPDPIAKVRLAELRRADLLDLRSRLLQRVGPRTVNRTMTALRTILREGVYRDELTANPASGISEVKYEKRTRGIFTRSELTSMFPVNHLGPWRDLESYCCFLLAATTGMRAGEILALEWKHLDLDRHLVAVEQAWKGKGELGKPKWGQVRVMPMPAYTAERLAWLRRQPVAGLVFPRQMTWWTQRFAAAMLEMGIDVRGRSLSPHSFRHTLNTLLRASGLDPAQIRAGLGWRSEIVQDGYTRWGPEQLGALENAVAGLLCIAE